MIRSILSIAIPCLLSILSSATSAEVIDAAEGGFTVVHRLTVSAPRADVYAAAVNDVSRWWSSDHTVSGSATNLYIDARPQGCFCERLGDGAGLVHMTVTFVNPTVMLRLTGGLGPLGLLGVNGNMTFEFDDGEARPESTVVTLRYAVGGYRRGGLDTIAPAVDEVLGEQLEGLKRYIEQRAPS